MSSFDYFAAIHPAAQNEQAPAAETVWKRSYCAPLLDGCTLEIPLTPLPGGREAIALLMSNQCDFAVTEHLAALMAQEAAVFAPDCVAAVPTMGLEYAALVARKLGHSGYAAMGFSQKFWYDEAYEEIRSSTSSSQVKRLHLDPHLLHRVRGKRLVIVDDVINTGASMLAAVRLLEKLGAQVAAVIVALTEGRAWERTLADPSLKAVPPVKGVGHIPLFKKRGEDWVVDAATL